MLLLPAASRAETWRFDFEVLRNGRPIGSQVAVVAKSEGETVVRVAVDLAVTFGPFALYRYRHRSTERWRDGRLATIEAETDDGTRLWLSARAEAIPHRIVSEKAEVAPLYTEDGEWMGLTFDLRGACFDYVPRASAP